MTFGPLAALAGASLGNFVAGAAQGLVNGSQQATNFLQHFPTPAAASDESSLNSTTDETQIAARLEKLHAQIVQRLEQRGIHADPPIQLLGGGSGKWMVEGSHPDLLQVENQLEHDAELREMLEQVRTLLNPKTDDDPFSERGLASLRISRDEIRSL